VRYGGDVWVESVVGKGTTFRIELPISSGVGVEEAPTSEPRESAATAVRILAVDIEPAFRELLSITLSADGHMVDRARDGEEAWDLVQSQNYDCITINMGMPRMGGQLLYELIKDYSNELARRCIFITGADRSKEVREFIASSGNPSLGKPFHLDDIRTLVLGHL
jgi:CheY-like chemotaxis protein